MSIYNFCSGCEHKFINRDESGKIIDHGCPSQYNPFDEDSEINFETGERKKISKCPRHDKFMHLEEQKRATRRNNL